MSRFLGSSVYEAAAAEPSEKPEGKANTKHLAAKPAPVTLTERFRRQCVSATNKALLARELNELFDSKCYGPTDYSMAGALLETSDFQEASLPDEWRALERIAPDFVDDIRAGVRELRHDDRMFGVKRPRYGRRLSRWYINVKIKDDRSGIDYLKHGDGKILKEKRIQGWDDDSEAFESDEEKPAELEAEKVVKAEWAELE